MSFGYCLGTVLFLSMSVATQAYGDEGILGSLKGFFNHLISSSAPSSKKKNPEISLLAARKAEKEKSALPNSSASNAGNNAAPGTENLAERQLVQGKAESNQNEQADTLISHIATYKISLDKNSVNDDIDDANGFMTIKIWDTGDGWVFEQNSSLIIYAASGEGEQVNTNVASWQDYAGNHYRFNSRTLRNGQIEDLIRGEAHKGAGNDPGKVIYHLPNKVEIDIPNETVFPLHHLINAVQKAMRGDLVASNAVFDGSAEIQEAVAVNTVISQPKESKLNLISETKMPADLNKVWSMTLGIYPLNSKSLEPEYEIKQDVLNHGIIKNMTLDYGTFQVVATLEKLEFFTQS